MNVAPFTGAWIETCTGIWRGSSSPVAPFTGAWIETTSQSIQHRYVRSLPSRERGLKRRGGWRQQRLGVAPFTGAWIETPGIVRPDHIHGSLPSRERGLKRLRPAAQTRAPRRSLHGSVD